MLLLTMVNLLGFRFGYSKNAISTFISEKNRLTYFLRNVNLKTSEKIEITSVEYELCSFLFFFEWIFVFVSKKKVQKRKKWFMLVHEPKNNKRKLLQPSQHV